MNNAVIGLGSNIDSNKNIKKSREILKQKFLIVKESSFVKTKPVGYTKQSDFLNGAILLKTALDFDSLKSELKGIETLLGREATKNQNGPRTIDLDILVWNGKIIDKDFYDRSFVKNSVLEVLPELEY